MQQDSLAYRVLKAKYFPMCDYIHAPLGNNPSFTWQSIRATQDLVKFGLKWRIDNGDSVRVWGDKWLPTPSTYKVSSPRLFLHPDTRVGELINKEEACWNSEVVDNLFLPHEAEDSTCDECGLTAETTGHLFWTCSKLAIPFEHDQCQSCKDLIWSLLMGDVTRTETAAKVVTGAWSLWNNRNEVRVSGDATQSPGCS
uniref:Reverse transcriptase zinc-binding domain-containing protein n=1 Tax=Quercus lobata TaxID=97700 RepID=A0A7N2N032_QUELO